MAIGLPFSPSLFSLSPLLFPILHLPRLSTWFLSIYNLPDPKKDVVSPINLMETNAASG
jgi:hypothetical protein